MKLKNDPNFEKKLTFCLKNFMRILVNFSASSGKSENLHFDGLLLSKVCNARAKKNIEELWREVKLIVSKMEFDEFSHRQLKVMLGKSSVHVLAEGMHFLDKSNPSNFNFLDTPLLVSSCPNSSYDF